MTNKLLRSRNLVIISILVSGLSLFLFIQVPTGLPTISENEVTKIYFADNISRAHQKVIDRFNKRYEGSIEVVPIDLPFTKFSTNERKQLIARSLRSKSSRIDIFAVDLIWVPRFVKWAEPLSSYFGPQERRMILNEALMACDYEGETYSWPLYLDIGVLYYRKDILRKLPDYSELERKIKQSLTWTEFVELSNRLSRPGRAFYIFPADNYEGLVCSFFETLGQENRALFKRELPFLESAKAQKGLNLLVDLVNRFEMTPPLVTRFREADGYEYSLENDAVFFRGWPGNLRSYAGRYPEKIDNIGIGAIPHFEGEKPVSVFGGWSLMISKNSQHKNEAVKFLQFATSTEMQKLMFEEMGFLPVNAGIYQDSTFLNLKPELKYYQEYFSHGFHRPAIVDYTKISDIISYYAMLAIKREISVADALKQAREQIKSEKVLIY